MTAEPTHQEIEDLLGAYALDAVSPDEARLVEAHLTDCTRCRAEVAGHREVAAGLAHSYDEPPAGLWSRIEAEIDTPSEMPADLRRRVVELADREPRGTAEDESDRPAEGGPDAQPARWASRPWPMAVAAAAAVVIVALLGTVVIRQESRIDELEQVAAPSMRDLADDARSDPDARSFELVGGDDTRVRLVVEPSGQGYVFADTLPELADDRTYQLWGIGDEVVSLGLLSSEVAAFRLPPGVGTLAITEEIAGGVAQPSQEPIVAGAVTN